MRDPNKAAKDWAMWCRRNGFAATTWSVGGVSVDGFRDLKVAEEPTKTEPPKTLWETYGAELMQKPVSKVDEVPEEAKIDD